MFFNEWLEVEQSFLGVVLLFACFLAFAIYRTRAIITRGLYTFYPIFEGQKRFLKGLFL